MAYDGSKFIIDKEELKPGLILFRRADVKHRNWYCRVKVPKEDRYKTVSLKTDNLHTARSLAWEQESEVRYAIKHGVALFNRPFREVAREFLAKQKARAKRGQITARRVEALRLIIEGPLDDYLGSVQVHLIGDERWGDYPTWRRENGEGRIARNGSRMVSLDIATTLVADEFERLAKIRAARGFRPRPPTPEQIAAAVQAKMAKPVPYVSDDTIRMEMKVFGAVMAFAVKQRYVPASLRFDEFPALKTMRREEFTVEEYRKLHTMAAARPPPAGRDLRTPVACDGKDEGELLRLRESGSSCWNCNPPPAPSPRRFRNGSSSPRARKAGAASTMRSYPPMPATRWIPTSGNAP